MNSEVREFRPRPEDLKRIAAEIPDAAEAMALDTIKDPLGLGVKPENRAGRGKQIADALKTIQDVKNKP